MTEGEQGKSVPTGAASARGASAGGYQGAQRLVSAADLQSIIRGGSAPERADSAAIEAASLVIQPQNEVPERPPLSPVPEPGTPPDRRQDVARWVVTLTEPLVPTKQRAAVDKEMAHFVDRNSDWACAYLAGVLVDIAHTLPREDPWLHMSGLIDLDQISTGRPTTNPDRRLARRTEEAPLPGMTGAFTTSGRPFGTRRDAADLLTPGVEDSTTDLGMVAVAENLSPLAAALVAFAAHDARTLQYVLGQTYHHLWLANFASLIEESAGEALLNSAGSALRWLIHRRRAYTSLEDTYPNVVGFAWISKADRVNAGTPILDEGGLVEAARIDDGEYRYIAGIEDDD